MKTALKIFLGGLVLVTGALHGADLIKPQVHPSLLITPAEVMNIRANLGQAPLFDTALAEARARMEKALDAPLVVPVPADAAGFTHERHKQNYTEMQLAGLLYQITGEKRFAAYVKAMLLQYAELYPTLGNHPAGRPNAGGRLFWQTLNENVWLVHTTQAYDCIYDTLTADERTRFETKVFRPMANFLSVDRVKDFDKIHNHGTWSTAAVGMAGYVMGDQELVQKSLYGSKRDGQSGFLRQLDELFSPDGYYVEGPYYARYVLMPFFNYAQVIQNNQPELKVFERRDGLLGKALAVLLQQAYVNGAFFPINDALKEKTIESPDVILCLDLAYARYGRDPQLLSIAKRQDAVALSPSGFEVARALAVTPNPPAFVYRSLELADGPKGEKGGLGVLRHQSGSSESLALMKYTSFGMDHGHFDKLNLVYYDQGREIISDYGAARFLNVEQKNGGRYLPENKSFAEQTIAHNTVVVDHQSQYGGSKRTADDKHSDRHFFETSDPDFQVVSARDTTAYPGVTMQRTVAMVRDARLGYPVVVDVYRVESAEEHNYDLPFYYQGHFLKTNVALTRHADVRRPLGPGQGYEHLWLEAKGAAAGPIQFTWMNGSRYYTVTAAADAATHMTLMRIGANDLDMNLRNEPAFMLSQRARNHVFASVIEPHGVWNGTKEFTTGGFPSIREVTVVAATADGTVVKITGEGGLRWTLCISNRTAGKGGPHRVEAQGEVFTWNGNAVLQNQ